MKPRTLPAPIPDLSSVSDDLIEDVLKQADQFLRGSVQLAIAADQRATTLTGIFGAGAVALLAAAATLLAAGNHSPMLVSAAGVSTFFLFLASLCSAWAARPIDFYVAGYEPRLLAPGATGERVWMLRCIAEDSQTRIAKNRKSLERGAGVLRVAMLLGLGAVPAGVIAFLVAWRLS
jgi:hypothetical protein